MCKNRAKIRKIIVYLDFSLLLFLFEQVIIKNYGNGVQKKFRK